VNGSFECCDVGEDLMGEVMCLEVMPDDLDIIEFGRILRQPLDGEPVGAGGKGPERQLARVDWTIGRGSNQGNTQNEKSLYHQSSIDSWCYLEMALFEPRRK